MKLLLAGGGTGGHLFPAVAIAEALLRQEPSSRVLFVGTRNGLEYRVLPGLGWDLETVEISGFAGRSLLAKLAVIAKLGRSVMQGMRILKTFQPDVVVGVGGYASAPLVLAARLRGLSIVLHEQNAIPGLSNRLLARWADRVCVAFAQAADAFAGRATRVTGNPLRSGMQATPLPGGALRTLLVFGGSRGARAINDAMVAAWPVLHARYPQLRVIHQTGTEDLDRVRAAYAEADPELVRIEPFITDMASAYRQADLVVCRAGATTIAELTACGRPAVLIPFPHAANDHQKANAMAMVEQNAALLLEQAQLSDVALVETVGRLLDSPEQLQAMAGAANRIGRLDAAETILDICRELIAQKRAA